MSLTINGRQINVQGVRELNPGLTIQQASQKTKNNGLDEVYFTSSGKTYIAYGDSLNIGMLRSSGIPKATYNGQEADIVTFDDEVNSTWEGATKGAASALKDTGDAVIGAVKNIITTIGPTVAVGGGAAVAGYSIYQLMKTGQIGASMAAGGAAGAAAGGISQGILDALKSGAVGALKIIAITGAIGAGVTATYGAVRGAMNAQGIAKDYSTITGVTTTGMAPANGGQPIATSELPHNVPINSNWGNQPTSQPTGVQPYFPIQQYVPPQQQQLLQNPNPNEYSFYQAPPQQVSGLLNPQALFSR